MKKSIYILLPVILFTACEKEVSDKVDQDKIFTQYELLYDQTADQTTASATFRFSNENGTRLKLSEPSEVTVDGSSMEWSDESANYQKSFPGFVPSAQFNWVDLDGNSFTNTANIRDIDFGSNLQDTIFHADSVTHVSWAGAAPLDTFETVILTIDGEGETDTRNFTAADLGATAVVIDSTRLAQIDSGMVTLTLEMRYSPELQEATSKGGELLGRYRTNSRSILLD